MDPASAEPAIGYAPLLLIVLLTAGFGAVMLGLGVVVRPSKPNPVKALPYECGNLPVGDARLPMRTRFYLFAMLLVVFDVEVVFLLPWAVNFVPLGLFGFVEMVLFLGILLLGYLYLWRNGGLQWD
jgi:NADH-quinone oxidoreductase subunit A